MDTDIGYLRNIYRWGILGSIIFYGTLLSFYYKDIKMTSSKNLRLLFSALIIWLFIYQLKELWAPSYLWPLFMGALLKDKLNCKTTSIKS